MLHHLHHHYHVPRLSGMTELFWAHGIRSLGQSLVAIFIPIYLYQIGYPLTEVFIYMVCIGVFWLALLYPMMRLINRFGATRMMALSMLFNIAQFALLLTLPDFGWPLWLIALTPALYTAIYWPAFRGSFAANLAHRRTGRVVGAWSAVQTLAVGIAPAIGGVVATVYGINALYLIAIAMFFVAAWPLLTGPTFVRHRPFKITWRKLWRYRADGVANLAETYNDITLSQTWPLFVFFVIPTYAGVGALSSVIVLTSILVSLYVGRREEAKGVRHYLREGTFINGIGQGLKLIVANVGHIFTVNFVSGVGYSLYLTSYNTRYYEKIEHNGLPYLFLMQIVSALAWIVAFGGLLLLTLALPDLPPRTVLLVGILAAVPMSFLIRKIH
ncbi:MAG TPA: MFS transporter [Patescibacteria group bacterium]